MKKERFPLIHSIISKVIFLAVLFAILLYGSSYYILSTSLSTQQEELIGSRLLSDINYIGDLIGDGDWEIKDNALYRANVMVGDGTEENANLAPFLECEEKTGTFSYTFILCSDEGLHWTGDDKTGYMQGHFLRVAGSTKGPNGESIIGTYMDKLVADALDANDIYQGPANVNGRQIYCVYKTLKDAQENTVGAIVVGRGIAEMEDQIRANIEKYIAISIAAILFVLIVLCALLLPWVHSIRLIEKYLKVVGTGEFPDKPLVLKHRDEMSRVADSINEMVENLRENKVLTNYRMGMKRRALFSICVNVSTGILTEGAEIFSKFADENGVVTYQAVERGFIKASVDPIHLELVCNTMEKDNLLSHLDKDPEFEVTFKASPERMLQLLNLSPEATQMLEDIERKWIWQSMRGVIVQDSNGQLLVYMDIIDVDQKMINEEKIWQQANTDTLTGILNRSGFLSEMSQYMALQESAGAMLLFDLDHFKDVNDNLGHPMGDELLKETAALLKKSFRDNDFVCRFGGDEFCVFTRGLTDLAVIKRKAAALNEKGTKNFTAPNGKQIQVTFSIGIALFPEDAKEYKALYEAADKALYQAKENGRNCYRLYQEL